MGENSCIDRCVSKYWHVSIAYDLSALIVESQNWIHVNRNAVAFFFPVTL